MKNQCSLFIASACHEVPYDVMLRIPHCITSLRDRRDVAPAAANPTPTQNKLNSFFNTPYFTLPFLSNPSSLLSVVTGSGVCTEHLPAF